jgi:acyl-CoA thioesterase
MNTHPFDTATALKPDGDALRGETSPAYGNMVGPFGGVTAATLLRAVLDHPDLLGEPVSLTVNFAGPVADGPFEISARPLRTNRSTQHWALELGQDGAVATTATAVTGIRRATWSATEAAPPEAPAPGELPRRPFPGQVAWTRNYDMRFVAGALPQPGSGESPDSTTTLWVRDEPPRPLDFASLTALCDVFYPRVFLRRGTYVPAGTVSMTVYFHADAATLDAQSDRPVLATARARHFGNGYFDQVSELWGAERILLATSHQLVYFKG